MAVGLVWCVVLGAVCAAHATANSANDEAVLVDEIVQRVNSAKTTWTAGHNARFEGITKRQARRMMGTRRDGPTLPPVRLEADSAMDVPSAYDVREAFDGCPSVLLVRDQSACGSCWAFAAVEAFNDRVCIATGNTDILSVTDVLSCCAYTCGMGCDGGYVENAWLYFYRYGVVTDACFPYPFAPCSHHNSTDKYPACPTYPYFTPDCLELCDDGSDWESSKVVARSAYSVATVDDMKAEIFAKGPVSAALVVYEDLLMYRSGTYQHVTGEELGGHAVEIVGYGTDENGVDYWTVKNSWNPTWGNGGFFNIIRGVDECGIESGVVAGEA